MKDRVNQPYKVQGSRVYGNGESYNVTNRITAENLCKTLNCYEKTTQEYTQIHQTLDKVQKNIITLQMDLKIVQDDLDTIKEALK